MTMMRTGGTLAWLLAVAVVTAACSSTPTTSTSRPSQPHSLPRGPLGSVVQVTAYSVVGPTGTEGPVVVEVGGRKAAAIHAAYVELSVTSSRPDCAEAMYAFSVSFLPRRGAPPTLTATEYECPSPGVVMVRQGALLRYLREDCAFQNAVVAALPPGRAEGTRHDDDCNAL